MEILGEIKGKKRLCQVKSSSYSILVGSQAVDNHARTHDGSHKRENYYFSSHKLVSSFSKNVLHNCSCTFHRERESSFLVIHYLVALLSSNN